MIRKILAETPWRELVADLLALVALVAMLYVLTIVGAALLP